MSILDKILNSSSKEEINSIIQDELTDRAVDAIIEYSPDELTEVSAGLLGRYRNAATKDKANKQMRAFTGNPDKAAGLLAIANKRVKGIENAGVKLATHKDRADKEQLGKDIADLPNKKAELEKHQAAYDALEKFGGHNWVNLLGQRLSHHEQLGKNTAAMIGALKDHINHTEKRAAALNKATPTKESVDLIAEYESLSESEKLEVASKLGL